MEQQQRKHAGLKKESAARAVSTEPALAGGMSKKTTKPVSEEAGSAARGWKELPTKAMLPAKIKSVVSFADHFFGRKTAQKLLRC